MPVGGVLAILMMAVMLAVAKAIPRTQTFDVSVAFLICGIILYVILTFLLVSTVKADFRRIDENHKL